MILIMCELISKILNSPSTSCLLRLGDDSILSSPAKRKLI